MAINPDPTWGLDGQEPLFDGGSFYDAAADPAQTWNLQPGLTDQHFAAPDDAAWDVLHGGTGDSGTSGSVDPVLWGEAS